MAGTWFQTFLTFEEERVVQKAALTLHAKGLILDAKGKRVRLKRDLDGKRYVPRYTVAKFAMLSLVNGTGLSSKLGNEGRKGKRKGEK